MSKKVIYLYAEDFREDVWVEEYCKVLGIDPKATEIKITVEHAEDMGRE